MRGGKREGAGRPKGVPNKLSGDLKAMVLGALDDAGGRAYLARQAEENPGPFLTLIGKILPTVVDATHRTITDPAQLLDADLADIAVAGRPRTPPEAPGPPESRKLH